MHIDPAWVAAGLLFITSGGGWVYTAIRNGKTESRQFGKLEGKVGGIVEGLGGRLDSVEKSVNNLSQRIDKIVDGYDGRGRRSKKP